MSTWTLTIYRTGLRPEVYTVTFISDDPVTTPPLRPLSLGPGLLRQFLDSIGICGQAQMAAVRDAIVTTEAKIAGVHLSQAFLELHRPSSVTHLQPPEPTNEES